MVLFDPLLEIGLIAIIVVVASRLLQTKFIDKKKQKETQASMKIKQAKIKELMKNDDEKSKNEMEQLQKELFEEMGEMMQGTTRYMMFSLPIFFGVFFVLGQFYGIQVFTTPFLVPKFEGFFMLNPFSWMPVDWVNQTGWLKWYIIIYFVLSMGWGIVLKIKDIAVKKKE